MIEARIMYATNFKPVFYPYTTTIHDKLTARGWTLRWLKFHLQFEKKITIISRRKVKIAGHEISWNPVGYGWLYAYVAIVASAIGIGTLLAIFFPNI
jgi:hypothetical protein